MQLPWLPSGATACRYSLTLHIRHKPLKAIWSFEVDQGYQPVSYHCTAYASCLLLIVLLAGERMLAMLARQASAQSSSHLAVRHAS